MMLRHPHGILIGPAVSARVAMLVNKARPCEQSLRVKAFALYRQRQFLPDGEDPAIFHQDLAIFQHTVRQNNVCVYDRSHGFPPYPAGRPHGCVGVR